MFLRAFDWALFSHVCCPFLDWRCNSGVDEYSKIGLPTLYFHCETLALEFQFFWTCQKYCCCCCCWSLVFRGPTYLQGAPLTGSTRTQSRVRTFEEESTAKWGISLVEEVLLVSNVTCGLFLVIFYIWDGNSDTFGRIPHFGVFFCGVVVEVLMVLRQAFSWYST